MHYMYNVYMHTKYKMYENLPIAVPTKKKTTFLTLYKIV